MSFLDSLTPAVSSAAGAALSFIGGQQTNQANIDIANANNQWSAQQYATRYQTQVKDLEAAGLNPMLAYMQSPGSAPTAQPVQLQNSAGEAVRAYNEGYSSSTRGEHDIASAGAARKMQNQIEATTANILEQTKKIPHEIDQIKFLIQKLAEEASNIAQDTENKVQARKQIIALVENIKKQTNLLDNQVRAEAAFDNFAREYKQYSPIIDLMKSIFLPRSGGITINK